MLNVHHCCLHAGYFGREPEQARICSHSLPSARNTALSYAALTQVAAAQAQLVSPPQRGNELCCLPWDGLYSRQRREASFFITRTADLPHCMPVCPSPASLFRTTISVSHVLLSAGRRKPLTGGSTSFARIDGHFDLDGFAWFVALRTKLKIVLKLSFCRRKRC